MSKGEDYEYIELNRTFHELSKWASEDDSHDLSQAFSTGPTLRWPHLLKSYRTIMLSEAGSGKTAEILQQANKLEEAGKPSFFVRLEHVAQDFDIAFQVGSPEAFEAWLGSIYEGWVFLDSIDEARLKSPSDFERAIKHMGRRLMKALDRVHIVITGRSSAWRARSDHALCVSNLPISSAESRAPRSIVDNISEISEAETFEGEATNREFRIVTLDSLTNSQIKTFIEQSGISDTKQFLTAIERADASSSTKRPQDLVEVVAYWKLNKKIGTRFELMQFSIERRLKERDVNRAEAKPLTPEAARKAAKLVAAAASLSKVQTVLLPDHEPGLPGVSLDAVLPGWNAHDQMTFLSRPIFDDAIYGAARFYHRTAREYLTAEWLNDLLQKQTSRRKIYQIIFREQYGLTVIPPTIRPILSWLVLLDGDVRSRVLKIAPEVVLEGGDPARLPIEIRRTLLNDICKRVAGGKSGQTIYDYGAVQRFSSSDIADEVSLLLEKYRNDGDITWFLLRMIWIGELKSCLSQAKRIALNAKASLSNRIAAFRAVTAVGTASDQLDLRTKILKERGSIKREWLGELITSAPYTDSTVIWIARCVTRAEIKSKYRYSSDTLENELLSWLLAAPIDYLINVIKSLGPLLSRKPVEERRYCEISKRFGWLMNPLCKAAERLIESRHPDALNPTVLDILQRFPAAKAYDFDLSGTKKTDLQSLVRSWPDLNRALLWHSVAIARNSAKQETPPSTITRPWEAATFNDLWSIDVDDFSYFVDQISLKKSIDDKLVSLTAAARLFALEGSQPKHKEMLVAASKSHPRLSERLDIHLNPPPPSADEVRWKQQEKKWKKDAETRARKQDANRSEWRKGLQEIPDKIRNPGLPNPEDISRPQWYLLEVLREHTKNHARWSDGRWELLTDEFGKDVATAFRDGAVTYWRKHTPKVRSEGAPANSTTHRVVFGLTGLEMEASSDPAWITKISSSEATLACRYASHEMNGFPPWFSKLFEIYPTEVTAFVMGEIEFELRNAKPNEEMHYMLSDVSWSGEWLWNAVAPILFSTLQSSEPKNAATLEKVLKIIQGSTTVSDHDIAILAQRKAKGVRREGHAARWFAVWTGVDSETAITALKTKLTKYVDREEATKFAMVYIQNLVGGRTRQTPKTRAKFRTPKHLKNIYLLMHQYIRRSEDIDRAGSGAYSPELRDEAQEARNEVFSQLTSIPGKDAFIAVDEISRHHPDEEARTFMFQHALKKAETDADLVPWPAKDVVIFADHFERTPADHRSLAELVIARLFDMKDDLEDGDTSLAKLLLTPSLSETDIRLYFGKEFRDKSNGRYVAPQEEELADAKRPDIRIHGFGFDAPVPVELKLADKWSGADLFERLRNQLGGDYLRDMRSSRGVFLLVWRGEQKSWYVPGRKRAVNFSELIDALQNYWTLLSPDYPAVDELTIVGIDLTKRKHASNKPLDPKLFADP